MFISDSHEKSTDCVEDTDEEYSEEKSHRTNRNQLVGVVHHGDEEIEENDDVDDWEASKHNESPESCEFFDASQLKVV